LLVSVVDDDVSVREPLPDLLRSFGFEADAFASAEAFLAASAPGRTHCLVLDVVMPGMSGLELQLELARTDSDLPIVFITSESEDYVRARAIRNGAVALISEPFSAGAIVGAVRAALMAN
jgi:FixJ family two-component response regulator